MRKYQTFNLIRAEKRLTREEREREINQKVGGGSQNQIQLGRKTKKTKQGEDSVKARKIETE